MLIAVTKTAQYRMAKRGKIVMIFVFCIVVALSCCSVCSAQEETPLNSPANEETMLSDTSDRTNTTDTADTTAEEPPKPWSLSLRSNYRTSHVRKGVELSGNAPTMDGGFSLSHDIGISFSMTGTERLGKNGFYQQTFFNLGYSYEAKQWLELSADLSFYDYPNDTLNPLAGTNASFSLAAAMDAGWFDIDLTFDRYFGSDAANYLSFDFSKYIGFGEDEDFSIMPSAGICFTSFELQTLRLVTKKGNTVSKTKKVRGLSSLSGDIAISYYLGKGFSLSLDPMLLIAFQQDVNSKSRKAQLLITAGVRYFINW